MIGPGQLSRLREPESRVPSGILRGCLAALLLVGLAQRVPTAGADASGSNGPTKPRSIAFTRDIRPILADKCFKCHGPDAKERKGKLRLDNHRDATAPAASGSPAIVPGQLE